MSELGKAEESHFLLSTQLNEWNQHHKGERCNPDHLLNGKRRSSWDDTTRGSIIPFIFDLLYRGYCRAPRSDAETASASVECDEVPDANCVARQIPKRLANGAPNAMETAFDRAIADLFDVSMSLAAAAGQPPSST